MKDNDDFYFECLVVAVVVLWFVLLLFPAGIKLYAFTYDKGYKQGQVDYMNGKIKYEKVQKEEYREIKIK